MSVLLFAVFYFFVCTVLFIVSFMFIYCNSFCLYYF